MRLYRKDGYLDMGALWSAGAPFTIIAAARGTGKTYGAIELLSPDNHPGKFIWMRSTKTQAELIGNPKFTPFRANPGDHHEPKPMAKGIYGLYWDDDPEPHGTILGLSTFANVRGFDASDIETIVYDEFIPQKSERVSRADQDAFLNAYETIGRNRELQGLPPVRVLLMANSNNLANNIFQSFGLVGKAYDMIRAGKELSIMQDRGIVLALPRKSPISEAKRETALYKALGRESQDFVDMALENDFAFYDSDIRSMPLRELRPLIAVGEICIYEHKGGAGYYVSRHMSGSVPYYAVSDETLTAFRRTYPWLWHARCMGRMIFEDAVCKILFDSYHK